MCLSARPFRAGVVRSKPLIERERTILKMSEPVKDNKSTCLLIMDCVYSTLKLLQFAVYFIKFG
jgi:hypothetical protein